MKRWNNTREGQQFWETQWTMEEMLQSTVLPDVLVYFIFKCGHGFITLLQYLLLEWSWASYLVSWNFSFWIYKTSLRHIIHLMGRVIKYCVQHSAGRGLENVSSFSTSHQGLWILVERFLSTRQILKNDHMWAGGKEWEGISSRQRNVDKAQRSEGWQAQWTLKPILAPVKSMSSGWFFPRRPQISLVTTTSHADKSGWISSWAFRGFKTD